MAPRAYYNEIDPAAAAWLRQLIAAGLIPDGDVDERDIRDVRPSDLWGYTQCHFFAGIGGWALALRWAGWRDEWPVWTGSCPCQPFSSAGKGDGFADERHLWPFWHHLIAQCEPPVVLGEQVASKDGLAWLDLVWDDLEGSGYALGPGDLCAAGVGAPHIRQRLWIGAYDLRLAAGGLGDSLGARLEGYCRDVHDRRQSGWVGAGAAGPASEAGATGGVADCSGAGRGEERAVGGGGAGRDRPEGLSAGPDAGGRIGGLADDRSGGRHAREPGDGRGQEGARGQDGALAAGRGGADGLGDPGCTGAGRVARSVPAAEGPRAGWGDHTPGDSGGPCDVADADRAVPEQPSRERAGPEEAEGWWALDQPHRRGELAAGGRGSGPGPVNGFWGDADWLLCRDQKWRPVEPGTFPLADGLPARVGRLRGYGNAISPVVGAHFCEAFIETLEEILGVGPLDGRYRVLSGRDGELTGDPEIDALLA